VLSTAAWQAMSWGDFCSEAKTVGGATSGGPSHASCKNSPQGENYYGSSILATLQQMESYGLQGDISVKQKVMVPSKKGSGSKPKDQLISLVKGCNREDDEDDGCFPAVPYCSVLPSEFSQVVEKLMNASIPCGSGARRSKKRAGPRGRHLASSGRAGAPPTVHRDVLQRLAGYGSSAIWDSTGLGGKLSRSSEVSWSDSSRGEGARDRSAGLRMKVKPSRRMMHFLCTGLCVLYHSWFYSFPMCMRLGSGYDDSFLFSFEFCR
jgi:hypothetical protein